MGLGIGEWGAGRLEFQGGVQTWEWGSTCLHPLRCERRMERQTARKNVNPLPKVQMQQPHLPRRQASCRGESLAGRNRGPSSWQPRDI